MTTPVAFVGFSAVVVLIYHARASAAWRQGVLAAANVCFLASFSTGYLSLLPLAGFLLLTYAGMQWIRTSPRIAFVPVVGFTLAAFVAMKRYAFVPSALMLPSAFVTIGLSYMLFRILHLVIDTRSGALESPVSFFSFFNYTANFATLSSGPIQLYPDFLKNQRQANASRLSLRAAALAIERIVKGVFKTNVLALLFSLFHARMVDAVNTEQAGEARVIAAALAIVYYPLFLFCNFSGYIDIVIGVGKLLGFQFPENFNRPFSASSFLDFWTYGWHVTLSSWLRMYVYNPLLLGLMRTFPSRSMDLVLAVFAFFVTFFLIGVWHGQTPEFLFFGFLLGLGVSVNKAYQLAMAAWLGRKPFAALAAKPFYVAIARGLTFTYFAASLTWFWSTWRQIAQIRTALSDGMLVAALLAVFAGSTIFLAIVDALRKRAAPREHGDPIESLGLRVCWSTAMGVIMLVVTMFANQAAPDIVYKAF